MADDKPEIEPRLPDDLLPRLEELQRRKERRGLTELEKMVVANDCKNLIDGMKPVVESVNEMLSESVGQMMKAMQPMVETMAELQEQTAESFEPGDER